MKIIHLMTEEVWRTVKNSPIYIGDTFSEQGFIHCCLPNQVDAVIKKWFPGRDDIKLLSIDTEKLSANLVLENLEGGEELFPHIYGPLNMDAVVETMTVKKE